MFPPRRRAANVREHLHKEVHSPKDKAEANRDCIVPVTAYSFCRAVNLYAFITTKRYEYGRIWIPDMHRPGRNHITSTSAVERCRGIVRRMLTSFCTSAVPVETPFVETNVVNQDDGPDGSARYYSPPPPQDLLLERQKFTTGSMLIVDCTAGSDEEPAEDKKKQQRSQ